MINDPVFSNTASWQIADDMTVYTFDGEKVGKVRNYDPQAGYVDVQKGWLFKKDFYVPLAAISSVDEDGITLKLTKDALEDDRYSLPPALGAPPPTEPVVQSSEHRWVDSDDVRKEPRDGADMTYERSTGTPLTDMPEYDRGGRPIR